MPDDAHVDWPSSVNAASGHRAWLGIRLDGGVDWDETATLIEDGYRTVATKRALAKLDAAG